MVRCINFERVAQHHRRQKNSLDTLKKYSSPVSINKRNGIIRILLYFQPLKNGEWIETKKGRLVKKRYNMGIEEIP